MFLTVDAARDSLDEYEFDEVTDEAGIAIILANLQHAIGFLPVASSNGGPSKAEAALGQTKLGGTPDLPKGVDWPVRATPENADDIIARGGSTHESHIKQYLARPFPYEFFAQIDLAEAANLGIIADSLPDVGRLLFFYDSMTGPWYSGMDACRVIWDQTPVDELERSPEPKAFEEMREVERAQVLSQPNEHGFDEAERLEWIPKFVYPSRASTLVAMLQTPPTQSLEYQNNAALKAVVEKETVDGQELLDLYSDLDYNVRQDHLKHSVLGVPFPEQDDPRYDAAQEADPNWRGRKISRDEWTAAFADFQKAAPNFVLLLQIDFADLQQTPSEGTLYFIIHKDNLAKRDFAAVLAVYQQT